jgi:hypothetical protein
MEQLEYARENGTEEQVAGLEGQIVSLNSVLLEAIENARLMWQAVGGQESVTAIAQLDAARVAAENFSMSGEKSIFSWKKVGDLLQNGLAKGFDTFAKSVAEGKGFFESARLAFLQFASDFMIQIAQMIIKQIIFNALKGTGVGNFLGIGTGHTGGRVGQHRVGSGNASRKVNPAVFVGAQRHHDGGVVGLRPGEVPIIAKEGERVLTEAEQRMMNKDNGVQSQREQDVEVRNFMDPADFFEAGAQTDAGRRIIYNIVKSLPQG